MTQDPLTRTDPDTDAARAANAGTVPVPILKLRLVYPGGAMLGPGKADLLEGIARTGSIAAAGRDMGMSYKRAWSLVETMNAAFLSPLVNRSRGGSHGGGAVLTETGDAVLAHYRALQTNVAAAGADEIAAISALVAPLPDAE